MPTGHLLILAVLCITCSQQPPRDIPSPARGPTPSETANVRDSARLPVQYLKDTDYRQAPETTTRLLIRGQPLDVEIAQTPEDRALGLMFRESLAPDSGMLFIFDSTQTLSFWMKNTWIPLDIAFVDTTGVIVDVQRMAPHDTTTGYVSARPVRYAVETNLGWFARVGIRVGDTIHGLPRLENDQ